ncbi:MAG TPA: MAPEG family protein [Rhodanobacteraceae bacterium]|nr:MAPEG family protein [Rhodanobacteraceae bacterium]
MRITGLYAALAALLIVILGMRVTLRRRVAKIGIGSGGDAVLAQRIRVHANATEYLPLSLLLLLILELNQTQPLLLHVFGCVLIASRVFHAVGLSSSTTASPGRAVGISLTWLVLVAMSLLLLWQVVATWLLT